jgi:hypothetical protein
MNYVTAIRSHEADRPPTADDLGDYVCWSRMQAEAGQGLQAIVARKEVERRVGNGLFMWGVGNAPAVAANALARIGARIPVVFSVMKSRPKTADANPSATVAWRRYFDLSGLERPLPANVIVTSRRDSAKGPKRAHFALMCMSSAPLVIERGTSFDVSAYRNAGGSGAPVGASQVTALLRRSAEDLGRSDYEVNLRAWLTGSYWVKLSDPVEVEASLSERLAAISDVAGDAEWLRIASDIRGVAPPRLAGAGKLLLL